MGLDSDTRFFFEWLPRNFCKIALDAWNEKLWTPHFNTSIVSNKFDFEWRISIKHFHTIILLSSSSSSSVLLTLISTNIFLSCKVQPIIKGSWTTWIFAGISSHFFYLESLQLKGESTLTLSRYLVLCLILPNQHNRFQRLFSPKSKLAADCWTSVDEPIGRYIVTLILHWVLTATFDPGRTCWQKLQLREKNLKESSVQAQNLCMIILPYLSTSTIIRLTGKNLYLFQAASLLFLVLIWKSSLCRCSVAVDHFCIMKNHWCFTSINPIRSLQQMTNQNCIVDLAWVALRPTSNALGFKWPLLMPCALQLLRSRCFQLILQSFLFNQWSLLTCRATAAAKQQIYKAPPLQKTTQKNFEYQKLVIIFLNTTKCNTPACSKRIVAVE